MFEVGDKILYPMHGAGIINEIEEKVVLGEKHCYYIMRIPPSDIKIMIPTDTADEIGVRGIITKDEGRSVLEHFRTEPIESDDNWNKRHRDNMERIKSGDIYKVLTVVKTLMHREKVKGLSTSERKMLSVARQIFMSELVLCEIAGMDDLESIMEDTIEEML